MNKQRKTSHILNVFQYDADGHVVLPASLALGIAPTGEDNSAKVPTTAWVRSIVGGAVTAYSPASRTITINGTSYDLSANRSWSIDTGVLTASAGSGISVSVVSQNLNIVNTGLLTATSGSGISVSTVNQNLNIVNTGLLTATAGAGISVSTVSQNLNIVNTGLLTATAGSGISVSVVNQNLNVVNTGILTASAGSGISLTVVGQNLNVVNTGVLTATAGAGISLSIVGGNLNVVNTITNNNQLTNGAGYITSSALTGYATETYVGTAISNLVDAAPGTLDTLNELAAALGDDPNFATTVSTSIGTKVPQARTITINGTSYDLTANRSWTINSMVYPSAGIALSTGTAWGTSITDNSANWNTAFGWGNHASAGYLVSATAATTYVSLSGSYANPAWITSLGWSKITSTPTTISGYGITNAYTDAQIQNFFNGANAISGYNKSNWDTAYGWGNHTSGGYLTTASAASTYVSLTGSYANPSWITSLAYSKITGVPAFLTSYTETDTLASVTARGTSTSATISAANFQNGYQVLSLNNIKVPGLYNYDGGISGTQPLGSEWYNVRTIEVGASARYSQFVMPYSATRIFYRISTDAGFQPYVELYHTGNIPTWNQNTTGTAGSISGFNNPTTGATANTIAYRDSGGDLYARYMFAVHFNQSGGNSENPTIGQIWTQNTTDNYVRKSTPAHFISQLGLVTGGPYLPLSGGNITGRVEFQYSTDKYSQAWRNNTTGAYWWVTTESDKLGFHRNGDGDKFYFSNGGDFWSSTNGWLSTALSARLPLSGGTLSGTLSVSSASIGMDWWRDGGGTYMEFYGTSTATRKLRLQGSNGSGSYAQWYIDGGNQQIYGDVAGVRNFVMDSTTAYIRHNGADKLWGGSDGTRNSGWAYHNNNDTGLHWPNNGWHFYPKDINDMYMRSGSSTNVAIAMSTGGTTRGYVYAENDNTIGFLNNGRGWAFRTYSNGDARVYGYLYVNGAGTSSSIFMSDTDEGQREIHCNSNRIGFLNQSGSWGSWCDDSGNWLTGAGVYAGTFYDYNNNAYYLAPSGESSLYRFTTSTYTRNGMNYLSINSPFSTRSAQSSHYQNGTMGWGSIDLNTIGSYWGSGFFDTWSTPSNGPGASSHYVGIQAMHYNDQNGNFHGWQMACAQEASNRWFLRSSWNIPNRPWVEMIHSGNIGSQSVSYASSAGSANNATTLAGVGISTIRGGISSNNFDFYVNGDANTYYPVVLSLGGQYGMHRYSISRGYSDPAPWDPIGTGSHRGGLTLTFDASSDIAWGGNDKSWRIIQFAEQYTNMVAGMALPVTDGIIVWLRGGGAYYRFHGPSGINHSATVYYSGYTGANGATYPVRTSLSNVDSEIRAKWPVRGFGDGDMYVSNQAVIHTGNLGSQTVFTTLYHNGSTKLYTGSDGTRNTGWAYHTDNGSGLHWPNNGWHLMPASNSDFRVHSGSSSESTFRMETNGTTRGYMYANSSNEIGFLNNGRSWTFRVENGGRVVTHGPIARNAHSSGFLEGSYNNIGGNAAYTNPIYTIGSSYNPTDSSLSNMYGIGYAHPNLWGSGKTPSWGLYVCEAGGINATIGGGAVTIWASNDIVAYSDIRVKDNIEVVTNAIEKIQAIRGVTFTRTDANDKDRNKRHAGVIAQEVLKVLPEVVSGTEEDMYSVAYGNMAALFIEAIKEQQKQIEELQNKLDNVLSSR